MENTKLNLELTQDDIKGVETLINHYSAQIEILKIRLDNLKHREKNLLNYLNSDND
jgi:hypothetical protein